MTDNNYIAIRSLTLLKAINDVKALSALVRVVQETAEDGKTYPVYLFSEHNRVKACYDKYLEQFGADNRGKDDPVLWAGYDEAAAKNKECMKLNTRNYAVIYRAFQSGQMGNLIGVRREGNKIVYRFAWTEELERIKDEEDSRSKAAWEARQVQEGKPNE